MRNVYTWNNEPVTAATYKDIYDDEGEFVEKVLDVPASTEVIGLVVTQVESKSQADIDRLVELGKPQRVIDKFTELLLPTLEPTQLIADEWYGQHLLVQHSDPDKLMFERTYDEELEEWVEVPTPNDYDVALEARTELETDNPWLVGYRGLDAPEKPSDELESTVWQEDNIDYRKKRKAAYKKLSPEGTFETTVGDMFDAIIKAIYGDMTELDVLAQKINDIKLKHPNKDKG